MATAQVDLVARVNQPAAMGALAAKLGEKLVQRSSERAELVEAVQLEIPVNDRSERLRTRLQAALAPVVLEIVDDSHKHVGHAGARDGRGHYSVRVVAERFRGLRPVARHRLVFEAAGDLLDTDIHALSIKALSPEEVE